MVSRRLPNILKFFQLFVSFIDIVQSSVLDLFTPILYSSSEWYGNSCLSFQLYMLLHVLGQQHIGMLC